MECSHNIFPVYHACEAADWPTDGTLNVIVLTSADSEQVPEDWRQDFIKDGKAVVHNGKKTTYYLTPKHASKHTIDKDCSVDFTQSVEKQINYLGFASQLFSSAFKFSRKQQRPKLPTVHFKKTIAQWELIVSLAQARNRSKQWANGRGDVDGVPQYFEQQALRLGKQLPIKVTIIKGDDLVTEGFRLMHAVGRASVNPPTFVNLAYNGNPDSDKWVAFVGKGVCFDAGGLDIKTADGMKLMYLDKHGACSVFSAFQAIVQQKLKVNVTCSMGFVQNLLSANSFRPSDIIKSRKGLTIQIGNTDAEGRLVLADCMHWTQEKFKTEVLIEQSTLTGAMIVALGSRFAGVFSNSQDLVAKLKTAGQQVNQQVWHMPVVEYHHELMQHKSADMTSHPMKPEAGSSQAGAFLEKFVEQGVQWVHMDIAGTTIVGGEGTGYGSKILIQYVRNLLK